MEMLTGVVLLVVVIGALVELFKRAGVNKRWLPAIGLALGLAIMFWQDGVSLNSFLMGVMIGLTPSGIWEFSKRSVGGR